MFNYSQTQEHTTSPEAVSLIIGGAAAALVSVIYALKNIRHSSCLGCIECDQRTNLPISKESLAAIETTQV